MNGIKKKPLAYSVYKTAHQTQSARTWYTNDAAAAHNMHKTTASDQ